MRSGLIVLNGNVNDCIGSHFCGGRIDINGDYDYISKGNLYGGDIYHKGMLIVKDGKIL